MLKKLQRIILAAVVAVAPFSAAFAGDNNKFDFKVSGFVNLTMSEDFNGSIDNYDFIPSLIDVPNDTYNSERFRMDFSTSRVNLDASTESAALGLVELHIDMDFRGGTQGSYTPRMRTAHIKIGDFMVGKTFSNFSDVGAMLPQVDFQGPAGYCFIYSPQIRYTHSMLDDHLSVSASLEYLPQSLSVDIQAGSFERISQKLPTIPAYLQYNWGDARDNYLRLSAICRPQSVYSVADSESLSKVGWGTQVSGRINLCSAIIGYYNVIYGSGISEYISDAYGSEIEYTVCSSAKDGIETTPMYSYNVGVQLNLSKSVWMDFAYSEATVGDDCELYSASAYHNGKFASANLFYSAAENLTFATEYDWGQRENMSGEYGRANRIYLMAQYNF